ncbi:MAG: isocitrate/isopropylmalate dehydrogenase family protein, partial [Clostridia bacterium]|nr:isocitrate/isopropylmalate dehydrogenase family protein [Clostridia bacterium]
MDERIKAAVAQFEKVMTAQLERVERMKNDGDFTDFAKLDKIIIGVCGGDGIGPIISREAARVVEYLLADDVKSGKIELRYIDGLTIENRVACMKAIPDDVLAQLKECHVILKGPTTTPRAGDPWPNIESANVRMRKELDLFANVRPVKVPSEGIDWTFFRENTEGAYTLGSDGCNVSDDLAVDFTVTTTQGTERIARLAYEYARKNGKERVSIITKANVVKTTDGKFLKLCQAIGKEYPGITTDDWYIDITTAKLVDEKRRRDFKLFILPNLSGDILTDEAAEFQGGVGTAGSANYGKRYSMFEAIHGSAPRMISEGRGCYADPCSMLRATVMML